MSGSNIDSSAAGWVVQGPRRGLDEKVANFIVVSKRHDGCFIRAKNLRARCANRAGQNECALCRLEQMYNAFTKETLVVLKDDKLAIKNTVGMGENNVART